MFGKADYLYGASRGTAKLGELDRRPLDTHIAPGRSGGLDILDGPFLVDETRLLARPRHRVNRPRSRALTELSCFA
jgi:hypothetical protein